MSPAQIEEEIRKLSREEAEQLLHRVQARLGAQRIPKPLTDEVMDKWKVRTGFAAGMTTDQYLRLIRDGDGS